MPAFELLLEPDGHPAAGPFKGALVADGIPFTQFAVDDVYAEVERLKALGFEFTQDATDLGPAVTAVFDDTCGNLIQAPLTARSGSGIGNRVEAGARRMAAENGTARLDRKWLLVVAALLLGQVAVYIWY